MVLNGGNLTLDTDAYVADSSLEFKEGNENNFNRSYSYVSITVGNLENGPYSAEIIFYDVNGKELAKETTKATAGSNPTERRFSATLKDVEADHAAFKVFDQGNMVFNGTVN
jgi:hypothetical protein